MSAHGPEAPPGPAGHVDEPMAEAGGPDPMQDVLEQVKNLPAGSQEKLKQLLRAAHSQPADSQQAAELISFLNALVVPEQPAGTAFKSLAEGNKHFNRQAQLRRQQGTEAAAAALAFQPNSHQAKAALALQYFTLSLLAEADPEFAEVWHQFELAPAVQQQAGKPPPAPPLSRQGSGTSAGSAASGDSHPSGSRGDHKKVKAKRHRPPQQGQHRQPQPPGVRMGPPAPAPMPPPTMMPAALPPPPMGPMVQVFTPTGPAWYPQVPQQAAPPMVPHIGAGMFPPAVQQQLPPTYPPYPQQYQAHPGHYQQ